MSATECSPYILSADASGLFTRWAGEKGYKAPSVSFFNDLSQDMQANLAESTGVEVQVVPEEELREELTSQVENSPYPVILLDRAYVAAEHPRVAGHLDITRAVTKNFDGFADAGICHRPGFPSIDQQIDRLKSEDDSPVVLMDDVIFSGGLICDAIEMLRLANRRVVKVIGGVGIGKGVERIEEFGRANNGSGIEVDSVRFYETVYDEVCERDFIAGIPMSGRTVIDGDMRWSAPYFSPVGDPNEWASIPVHAEASFSMRCLTQSIELWKETERLSGCVIPADVIPRRIQELDCSESIVKSLGRLLDLDLIGARS